MLMTLPDLQQQDARQEGPPNAEDDSRKGSKKEPWENQENFPAILIFDSLGIHRTQTVATRIRK
jgi:hypothetical protein